MGYCREIIVYQHPRINESQLVSLIKDLNSNGWLLQGRSDNDNITYTLNAGDWIQIDSTETVKLFDDLGKLPFKNSFGGIQLRHPELERIVWVYQYDGKYRFELQISSDDDEIQLFNLYYDKLKSIIENLKHILHIEWRTHHSNDVVRRISNVSHEGVLIVASSNRLKRHFATNDFDYDFPGGLNELLESNIIIAINCLDYSFTTILEAEKLSSISVNLLNNIKFEQDDELLILNHSQFTMICHYNKGDYTKHGDIITSVPIDSSHQQCMAISKSGDGYEGELIIQFVNHNTSMESNYLIQIDEVPTHNNR